MAYIPSMPSKGLIVRCTECEGDFHLTSSNLRCKRIENPDSKIIKLYEIYYRCTDCNHKYRVCIIDGYLKNVLGPKIKTSRQHSGNSPSVKILLKTYKERLDQLNGR